MSWTIADEDSDTTFQDVSSSSLPKHPQRATLLCHASPGGMVSLEAKLAIKTLPTTLHPSQIVFAPKDCLRSSFYIQKRHHYQRPHYD